MKKKRAKISAVRVNFNFAAPKNLKDTTESITARTEKRGNLANFWGSSPSSSSWSTVLLPGLGARDGGFEAGLEVGLEAGRDGGLEPLGGVLDWEAGREI